MDGTADASIGAEWLKAPEVQDLEEADYWKALESNVGGNQDEERRLRLPA
jgi:hypothetical protein